MVLLMTFVRSWPWPQSSDRRPPAQLHPSLTQTQQKRSFPAPSLTVPLTSLVPNPAPAAALGHNEPTTPSRAHKRRWGCSLCRSSCISLIYLTLTDFSCSKMIEVLCLRILHQRPAPVVFQQGESWPLGIETEANRCILCPRPHIEHLSSHLHCPKTR